MEQNPVRFGRRFRQRLRLVRWDIQDLHCPDATSSLWSWKCLFHCSSVTLVRELLVNEVFDLHQFRVGLGREEDHALHDFRFNRLTIVMIGPVDRAIFMAMRGNDVDGVASAGLRGLLLRARSGGAVQNTRLQSTTSQKVFIRFLSALMDVRPHSAMSAALRDQLPCGQPSPGMAARGLGVWS